MKKTKVTGRTNVGEVRLAAIDVGFDLRSTKNTVTIPEHFESVGLEIDGEVWLIEGTRAEMLEEIRKAGYAIND